MFCFPEDHQVRHLFHKTSTDGLQNSVYKSSLYLIKFNTVYLFRISLSHFKYSLKIFATPLFFYNVLLFYDFKRVLTFLHRDLSKSHHYRFVLLQTQQCDVNLRWNKNTWKYCINFRG